MVIFDVTTPKPKQNKYPTFLPFHKPETSLSPPPQNLQFTPSIELAKKVLSEAPILHNLDWSLEFFLETDASQYRVGAILYQETEEGKRYVDFAAKAFNKAQQNYNAAKRELLAGLYAMNCWRPWLLFRKFTWGLDSKAVSFINTLMNQVVLDWINIFMDFDFETRFKRSILNVLPHQLSHMYDMLQLDFGRGVTRDRDFSGCSGRGFGSLNN